MRRFLSSVLAASFVAASIAASPVDAQTVPYSFSLESFSIPERSVFDDFDDGVIDPAWDGTVRGGAVESGSTLTLSNPGEFGFLPAPLVNEVSAVSGRGLQLDFGGSFTATSVWTQAVPQGGQSFSLALGSQSQTTGFIHQLSISLANTLPSVQQQLGGDVGLGVSVLSVIRDSPSGNVLSLTRTSVGVLPSDIRGNVHLALAFDDAANTLQPLYSVDGGVTVQPVGAAQAWNFSGGGFSVTASSTVPEPGTALLLGLGLAALSRHGRVSED